MFEDQILKISQTPPVAEVTLVWQVKQSFSVNPSQQVAQKGWHFSQEVIEPVEL